MDITNGVITIPNMTIESTLGHYELSGEQSMIGTLDYYIRIPWKIIRQGARYKLFGNKKTKDLKQEQQSGFNPIQKVVTFQQMVTNSKENDELKRFKKNA